MSLTCRYCPMMAAKQTSIWAEFAIAKRIICMRRPHYGQPPREKALSIQLRHVWKDLRWSAAFHTPLCSPYQPRPSFRASKLRVASGTCLDRHMGAWFHKYVNPLLQRPSSITHEHVQRIMRGWGCLFVPDLPPPPHNGGHSHLALGRNLRFQANNIA